MTLRNDGDGLRAGWLNVMDLRTVLVDDEQLARDELGYLLGQVGGVEVVGQAGNGLAGADDDRAAAARPGLPRRADAGADRLRGGAPAARRRPGVAHHLRHGVRSARDRSVRGQRRRLSAEAGRSGAARDRAPARAPADRVGAAAGRRRPAASIGDRPAREDRPAGQPSGRAAASGWRSRSASGSCWCRRKKFFMRRWPTKASP